LLFKKYLSNPTEERKEKHRLYRNILNRVLEKAEEFYFHELIGNTKHSVKSLWDTFGPIINPEKKSKTCCIGKLLFNGHSFESNKDIANAFNTYFSNIGSKLSDKCPNTNVDYMSYMGSANPSSMFMYGINEEELTRLMLGLNSRKSAGSDGMPPKIVRKCHKELIPLLLILINRSLSEGIFPDRLKIAKVIPIFHKKITVSTG
jgi:hypothetical protein